MTPLYYRKQTFEDLAEKPPLAAETDKTATRYEKNIFY
jgi:hypothetical protein